MTHAYTLVLAGIAMTASMAFASAEPLVPEPVRASQFQALAPSMSTHQDYSYYDRSGSRGRLGLGANPAPILRAQVTSATKLRDVVR